MSHRKKSKAQHQIELLNYVRQKFISSSVVILGSYINRKPLLKKLKILLQSSGYTPIIVKTIKNIEHITPRQKIHGLLSIANFVVAEDTEPSGEVIELEYCRHVGVITAIICKKYERSSWMTWDFEVHSNDFQVFSYDNEKMKDLEKLLKKITSWVKDRMEQRRKKMKEIEDRINGVS